MVQALRVQRSVGNAGAMKGHLIEPAGSSRPTGAGALLNGGRDIDNVLERVAQRSLKR